MQSQKDATWAAVILTVVHVWVPQLADVSGMWTSQPVQ
jgi:hypothetical protein